MEFRLLFKGELLPSGNNNPRPEAKQVLRRQFHPQLRRQWKLNKSLQQLASHAGKPFPPEADTEELIFQHGIKAIASKWSMFGFNFIPLGTEEDDVTCALDILLLRPEESRFVYTQGDVDGQIKTIFDALSMPRSSKGLDKPADDENPLYVLLENNRLISEVHVTAEQLLLLPDEREVKANDAFAVIHVTLGYRFKRFFDNYLG